MKNINLYFFYFSRNILWSIFLIIKEEKTFPKLIFLRDISRYNLENKKRTKSILDNILIKIFFIKQLNILDKDCSQIENIESISKKMKDIYENNISFDNKSLFLSRIKKITKDMENKLLNAYMNGLEFAKNNQNSTNYIFNGRKAPVFMFFEGLSNYAEVKRIEITFKNNKRHVYASPGYLWAISNINDIEKKYGFLKDFSFYQKRLKGLDYDGKKFVKNINQTPKYKDLDISLFLATPYEFIGFSHTSTEYINILKNSFREIIRFKNLGYKCLIRNHPNFKECHFLDKKLYSKWFAILRNKGVLISDYNQSDSSYDIAKETKINITVGSTIGGELSFMGKKSYDINLKSQSMVFKIIKPYDFEEILKDLDDIDSKKFKSEFELNNFLRFSGYNLGWGYEIPYLLQIGL